VFGHPIGRRTDLWLQSVLVAKNDGVLLDGQPSTRAKSSSASQVWSPMRSCGTRRTPSLWWLALCREGYQRCRFEACCSDCSTPDLPSRRPRPPGTSARRGQGWARRNGRRTSGRPSSPELRLFSCAPASRNRSGTHGSLLRRNRRHDRTAHTPPDPIPDPGYDMYSRSRSAMMIRAPASRHARCENA
jgi:hypothetical protein